MKKIFFVALAFCLLLSFSSCKQCTECTKFPGDPVKLCKKDYASDDSYNSAYKHLIAQGYKCD